MDILDAFKMLAAFLQKRGDAGQVELDSFYRLVANTLEELVSLDDLSTDKAKLLQAELRAIYKSASGISVPRWGNLISPDERTLMILVDAVAEARIYFWLKTFDGNQTLEGMTREDLKNETDAPILSNLAHQGSIPALCHQLLSQLRLDRHKVSQRDIEEVRLTCLSRIAAFRVHAHRAIGDISRRNKLRDNEN